MIQVQIIVDVRGDNDNHIQLNVLEREDANEAERELVGHIEDLFKSIFEQIRDGLGESEVTITEVH